jgi:putative DNA primase/helicase
MLRPPQWIRWHRFHKPGDKKPTKIPDNPNATGEEAKTNDPETWATFERAARRYLANDGVAGVGFVYTEADPYAGIDLDNCRSPETGEISPWAQNIIDAANTYTEVSPSGTGVKLYGRGVLPGHRGFKNRRVEIYDAGRWFAVTGEHVEGTPNEARDIQHVIDGVLVSHKAQSNGAGNADDGDYPEPFDMARALVGVPEGERDNTLWKMASKMRRLNYPQKWAETAILTAAANCTSPFDPDAALDKVRRAYREYEPVEPSANGHGPAPQVSRPLTDLGNAERLASRIRGKAVYVYEAKGWYVYTGKRWEPDTTGEVYRYAAETVRGIYADAEAQADEAERKKTAKWAMASEARTRLDAMVKLAANVEGMTVSATIFDTDPYILACNNGTVDLRTGELRPSRAEDFISKLAPVEYMGINTFAPRWQKFLEEIIPDQEIRDYLQVAAGYGATGLSNARAFFICHGHGRNGKGTFLETVRDVLGDYGHTAKPETFLESRREGGSASTDVASLKGTRLVVTSETKRGAKIDTNLVKSLTGDDTINARHLFERPMEFKPSWSVLMATNHKPEMPGDDSALWERIKLIPFTVRISDEQKDTALKAKLMAEGSGILAWIVRGAMRYFEHGLRDPAAIREAVSDYQTDSDPVGDFIARCLEVNPGDDSYRVSAAELRQAWIGYCDENDIVGVEVREVSTRLKGTYGKILITAKSVRSGGQVQRTWTGFRLSDEGDDMQSHGEGVERIRHMMF